MKKLRETVVEAYRVVQSEKPQSLPRLDLAAIEQTETKYIAELFSLGYPLVQVVCKFAEHCGSGYSWKELVQKCREVQIKQQ